jgi:hypothetical protein
MGRATGAKADSSHVTRHSRVAPSCRVVGLTKTEVQRRRTCRAEAFSKGGSLFATFNQQLEPFNTKANASYDNIKNPLNDRLTD